jgi:uncharacterized tellurite resistance protein B-like protein
MLKFFNNQNTDKKSENNQLLSKTASLLIHVAKIDENYTIKEKDIIKQTLIQLGAKNIDLEKIVLEAENIESESNQILDFTKEIKNTDDKFKIQIFEALWKIIYSNDVADMYETNLMRRLAGLLYLDSKTAGDIKERAKQSFNK